MKVKSKDVKKLRQKIKEHQTKQIICYWSKEIEIPDLKLSKKEKIIIKIADIMEEKIKEIWGKFNR